MRELSNPALSAALCHPIAAEKRFRPLLVKHWPRWQAAITEIRPMVDSTGQDTAELAPQGAARAYSPNAIHSLRTAQTMTLSLSQMADQKASILMGAAFVVFSISVSRSLGGHLPWSLAILALFAFLSALLAAIAVMPSAGAAKVAEGDANPLFFGHFTAMDKDEWTRAMLERFRTDEALFRAMLNDLYQNGQVLQRRKYRFLGYAYRTFVTGLVVTLVSFAVELALGR
jgi:hypothetical protein